MAWDTLVFGTLSIPDSHLERWLTTEVSSSDFTGWPDLFEGACGPRSPEVMLEQLRQVTLQPHEFIELNLDRGELSVRAMLSRDAFLEVHLLLATLWRSGAACDSIGSLQLFGENTMQFGYRVEVLPRESYVEVLTVYTRRKAQQTRQWREVDAHAQASLRSLLGAPRRRRGEPDPFTGR